MIACVQSSSAGFWRGAFGLSTKTRCSPYWYHDFGELLPIDQLSGSPRAMYPKPGSFALAAVPTSRRLSNPCLARNADRSSMKRPEKQDSTTNSNVACGFSERICSNVGSDTPPSVSVYDCVAGLYSSWLSVVMTKGT